MTIRKLIFPCLFISNLFNIKKIQKYHNFADYAPYVNLEAHIISAGLCLNYLNQTCFRGFEKLVRIFSFSLLCKWYLNLILSSDCFPGLGWSFIWQSPGCGSLEQMFQGCNHYSRVGRYRTRIHYERLHQRFVEGEELDLTWPAETQLKCSLNALPEI